MATKPGIFHLPRPSYRERRNMQSQPAQPPMQMQPVGPALPTQTNVMPNGQPNMNLSEPILGVGERSGQTYFRAGEVPERITFTPTAPGTPPVPPPPAQPTNMYNAYGQYNAPAPIVQPAPSPPGGFQPQMSSSTGATTRPQMAFAGGGAVQVNPTASQSSIGGTMDLSSQLTNYLQANPQTSAQNAADLATAVHSLQREVDSGRMSAASAYAAFNHYTSSLAPPPTTPAPPMNDGSQPQTFQADSGVLPPSAIPPNNNTNFGLPFSSMSSPSNVTASTEVYPSAQRDIVAPQLAAMPPGGVDPKAVAPPAPSAPTTPSAPASGFQMPNLTPTPPIQPAPRLGYRDGPANRVAGNPAIPILAESPAYNAKPDIGPHAPAATAGGTAGVGNPIGAPPTAPVLSSLDPQGNAVVQDYVHGGQGHFDPNTVNAITSVFPPEWQNTAFYIASAESHGNNNAIGGAGEIGLFQIHPVNWDWLTKALGTPINAQTLKNPIVNAEAAYAILSKAKGNWAQDWTTAPTVLRALGGAGNQPQVAAPTPAQPSTPAQTSASPLPSQSLNANNLFGGMS